jgi:quercetin dioxygenase-like cupin family protein
VTDETKTIPVEFGFARAAEAQPVTPEPGVTRTLGAYNQKFLLVQNRLAKDWVGTAHSHPHDQAVYLVSGRIRVVCASQTVELRGGDSFVVAGGVVHQVTALEDSVAIDLFTPCREEFLA